TPAAPTPETPAPPPEGVDHHRKREFLSRYAALPLCLRGLMNFRTGHGAGAAIPRIEITPADELPDPIPGQPERVLRLPNGRFADRASARTVARRGGLAKGRTVRLVASLGLAEIAEDSTFKPYRNGC